MKTYEVMMSYYPTVVLLVLACLCGVEGHSKTSRETVNHQNEPVDTFKTVSDMFLLIVLRTKKAMLQALQNIEGKPAS